MLELAAAPALLCGTLAAGAAIHFTVRLLDLLDISVVTTIKLILLPLAAGGFAVLAVQRPSSAMLWCGLRRCRPRPRLRCSPLALVLAPHAAVLASG
ncbi:hypothetical protein MN032_04960 [Agromyces atrinae]|uniref:hypothetical protein n=1 Tax=Agromyces atrinae TaxID=592376 RepID=UPI001F56DAE4|nr:hypothetical protein [Agromyces atrinae]MCI2957034.1 hypothetical protein [Agromyces atrinae]